LIDAIDHIRPAIAITPTDLYGAVIEGTAQWEDRFDLQAIVQGALIVITDGADTAGRYRFQDAVSATIGKSVYTLGVGSEAASNTLAALGQAGYFSLHDFNQLSSTLETINRQVSNTANSFYYLHYASPKRRAEGDASNSDHQLEVSVLNNANQSDTATIVDSFNSAEFSNVQAQVIISGNSTVFIGEQSSLRATTRWGPTARADYYWTFTSNTGACSMDVDTGDVVVVTAIQAGTCTVSAQDMTAGDARAWISLNVRNR